VANKDLNLVAVPFNYIFKTAPLKIAFLVILCATKRRIVPMEKMSGIALA